MSRRTCVVALLVAAGAIALASFLGASSRGATAVSRLEPIHVRLIPAPQGAAFYDATWVTRAREIVVNLNNGTDVWSHHLFALRLNGTGLRRLPIPDDPQCPFNASSSPAVLPDGGLAFIRECYGTALRVPDEVNSLMALDLGTGAMRRLRRAYLPFRAGNLTISKSGVAVINDGYGLGERLRWVRHSLVAFSIPLARAGTPRFSPDGRWIAVDGVPKQAHAITPATSTLARTLYIVSADGKHLRPLITELTYVARAAWSPDGRWLALAMDPRDGPEGLWLVNARSGKHFLIMPAPHLGATEWLPHSRTLIASTHTTAKTGLYVVSLPNRLP